MKEISNLSKDLEMSWGKLVRGLMSAQSQTANDILDYLKVSANVDTGDFIDSIYRTNTTYDGEKIETFIGSDLQVTSSDGKSYNLGWLLETGTRPHIIKPVNASALRFEVNGKEVFAKEVNHPGTIAYNNYKNAMNTNRPDYRKRISNAVKEAMK